MLWIKRIIRLIGRFMGVDNLEVSNVKLWQEIYFLSAKLSLIEWLYLRDRIAYTNNQPSSLGGRPRIRELKSLSEYFSMLEQAAPKAFTEWIELLKAGTRAYCSQPSHSCSVKGNPMAELFTFFIRPFLRGWVLDVGCGPQAVPVYLEGYPTDLIYGIDPISSSEDHPFTFIQGVAEFLPWEDNSFDVVIAATSLDHVLLLDRALSEIQSSKGEWKVFSLDKFRQGSGEVRPLYFGFES